MIDITDAPNLDDCILQCWETLACQFSTYNSRQNNCYLSKKKKISQMANPESTSTKRCDPGISFFFTFQEIVDKKNYSKIDCVNSVAIHSMSDTLSRKNAYWEQKCNFLNNSLYKYLIEINSSSISD